MWDFLNSLLKAIIGFIHWLVFVKLTDWEKNRLRRMGVESQEELEELMRQRYKEEIGDISPELYELMRQRFKDEIGDFTPEQEAELIRRYPEIRSALEHRESRGQG
ncbi:hypothetical protein NCS52_01177600 [Fusarium sp. LHS14.1]|nr:hypothetical protein NCS52_01177600 [Fusarium sp. LHS14.1]